MASVANLRMTTPRSRIFLSTGVGPEFLGRVKLGSSIASLVGVWIFQSFLKETKISKVLLWTALASVPLGFTQVKGRYSGVSYPCLCWAKFCFIISRYYVLVPARGQRKLDWYARCCVSLSGNYVVQILFKFIKFIHHKSSCSPRDAAACVCGAIAPAPTRSCCWFTT